MMMINRKANINICQEPKSENSFFFFFAMQFFFFILNMFLNVKIGVTTLLLTFIMMPIILMRCSSKGYNMSHGFNAMTYLFIISGIFYLIEIANPNHVQEAWNISIAHYWVYPIAMAIVVPIAIRNQRGIEVLLIIWSIFIIVATIKGFWQKAYGFNDKERYFLYVLGGYRTHIIWSGIRYFSLFSDAANYGVHSAMAATTFMISALYVRKTRLKFYFALIAMCGLYGMAISGTRAAIAIPLVGIISYSILIKNWKSITLSAILFIGVFSFFFFTNIGNGNPFVYKMRSAFRPSQDASYIVRVENRKKMKELMSWHPIGYGVGLSKGERFNPKKIMPYPPDSWLVSVWIETGIIGLILYLVIHAILFITCAWILYFRIVNIKLRGLLIAWLCMDIGFFVSAYANDVMQYPNSIVVYTGFALCIAGPYIEQRICIANTKSIYRKKIHG